MNEVIYRDLKKSYIQDKVKIFAKNDVKKLELHTKATAKQYLDKSPIIRLLCTYPCIIFTKTSGCLNK